MKPLILLLIVIPLQVLAPEITFEQKKNNIEYFVMLYAKKTLYAEVIENIKIGEGLILNPYRCPSSHPTIGYGHLIKKGEKFSKLTIQQADSLLKVDFNKRLDMVDSSLTYNKRLAITHFIFNLGIGNYRRSTLYKKVKAGVPIDSEIIKWCHYRKNGKLIKSNWLLKTRKFELNLFKTDLLIKTENSMTKCSICGNETRKGRNICIGCTSLKEVGAQGKHASGSTKDIAVKHLEGNPGLIAISWPSFNKRKKAQL